MKEKIANYLLTKKWFLAIVINRLLKDPIDICVIPEVYKTMIDYRNEHSKNQHRQLAVSCKVIKTILLNGVNGL
jgi:hypothetical protein